MLPKFCAGTLITDLDKRDMFWLVLRILTSIKFVQIFCNIQPVTIYLIPTSTLHMPLQKLVYHDSGQPIPNVFSACVKNLLNIHLTYTNAPNILSDKKIPKQGNEWFVKW